MADDFSFHKPKKAYQNPLTAEIIVTDRSDGTNTASTSVKSTSTNNQAGKMGPPRAKRPGKIPLEKGYSQVDWMRLQNSGQNLTGLQDGGLRKNIAMEEVEKHNSTDDAWTVLRGRVYNITAYMKFHPGGVDQLKRGAGKDCTDLFMKYHAWVNAEMMLAKCLIGTLAKKSEE